MAADRVRGLPRPTTPTELYLAAILDELRQLRQKLELPQPPGFRVSGPVFDLELGRQAPEKDIDLKEPEPAPAKGKGKRGR